MKTRLEELESLISYEKNIMVEDLLLGDLTESGFDSRLEKLVSYEIEKHDLLFRFKGV